MIPVRYDFKFWTNSDFSETITMSVDGVPFDFTGHSVTAQFRRTAADATVLFSLATVVTEIEGFLMAENGFEIRVDKETLSAAYDDVVTNATLGLPVAIVADIVVTTPTGAVETWFVCTCEINYGVTR